MDKFLKRTIAFSICILTLFALCACNGADFSKLEILAEDVVDVPESDEYTLQYQIKDYEKFSEKFNLTLTVRVFDENQNAVEVKNNRTIKVEKNKTYTVNIICSAQVDGEIKTVTKIFTVTAVKEPKIYLYAGRTLYKTISVQFGETYPIESLEYIPDHYPNETPGIKRTITSKKWTVEINGETEELTQKHLENIQSSITLRAVYTYKEEIVKLKLQYFGNGGLIEDEEGFHDKVTYDLNYGSIVSFQNTPKRVGYIFDGWYSDEKLTELFTINIDKRMTLTKNTKLYAKWIKERNKEWNEMYEFTKNSYWGYDYYTVKFIGEIPSDGKVLLPVGKDNIPVRGLTSFAFSGKAVRSVTIPNSYDLGIYGAFNNCTELEEVVFEENSRLFSISDQAFKNCSSLKSIAIPEGVANIDLEAFSGCTSLQSVEFPSTLTVINEKAFYGCASLTEVTLPDGLTKIYRNAFANCLRLNALNIGEKSKLEFISVGAFGNTALNKVTLPYAIKSIPNPFPEDSGVAVDYFPELQKEEE